MKISIYTRTQLILFNLCHKAHGSTTDWRTSNLSKAHVTRDSSGSATLAISVGLQQ